MAGFVLVCTRMATKATGTLVKKSDSTDNYHAKALGAVTVLLVIKAATSKHYCYLEKLKTSCANMGILQHGNTASRLCPSKQVQADIISLMKKVTCDLPCKLEHEHAFGHFDDSSKRDSCV